MSTLAALTSLTYVRHKGFSNALCWTLTGLGSHCKAVQLEAPSTVLIATIARDRQLATTWTGCRGYWLEAPGDQGHQAQVEPRIHRK